MGGSPEVDHPAAVRSGAGIGLKRGGVSDPRVQSRVDDHHRLSEAQATGKVSQRAIDRGGSQVTHHGDVTFWESGTPDHQTG